ncbi:uncharacterized protein LOC110463373 isoform X2 [Mizuhopecten yessoensis]|uniref:uncharacterized protein LOC110463373 isoform X2 n=1 Tax=Mizuhopecten yessoensis TaxID=6573 RepID=UPI000B45DAF6|nr:uncharacterized protein LOC110463373 isoform X2 [Mizuhopecten yessoensis]
MELKLMCTFGIFVLEVSVVWAVTFYKELMTWPDAVRFCKESGGELVKDIAIQDVPQEKAWVGRRIKDGYKLVMTNGCYTVPPNVTSVRIPKGSFVECLEECPDSDYNISCFCLTKDTLKKMHTAKFCDFIKSNINMCTWLSPPKLSCGGNGRMSTYRYQTQGFSLPLNYTDGTHTMLCAKWKGRGNGGDLVLTGCEQQLKVVCANGSTGSPRDWNAALNKCYDLGTDLQTCDKNASSCRATISQSIKEFWVGGFGYNVIEYTSDYVDVSNSSLCGTFGQLGGVVTYLPCGEKRPFICDFTSHISILAIVVSIVGLIIAAVVVAIFVRRFRRSRKSAALDILSRENDENQSDINFVSNEYRTVGDSQIGTGENLRDTDGQVGTNYDEIRPLNSGYLANNSTTNDNYDHARIVDSPNSTFQDNYDHMQITGLAHKTINDDYDHMPKPNSSEQTSDGNYDLIQKTNPSVKIIDDDYDHVQIS